MNKQNQFRVWDVTNKKFLPQSHFAILGNGKLIVSDSGHYIHFTNTNKENYLVQEYTGLNDAKGNEIFEGDILQFSDEDKGDEPCEVIYELGMFGCNIIDTSNNKDFWQLYYVVIKLEPIVIGNIFEHKHLLEK